MSIDTLVVNFFGGPGAGKSTLAMLVTGMLKMEGMRAEIALEYAKDLVWEKRLDTITNQIYVFGKQLHRIQRLIGQVDVVVTDSPLPTSLLYKPHSVPESFDQLVIDVFRQFNNLNFLLCRVGTYDPVGRIHTYQDALEKDRQIKELLMKHQITYTFVPDVPQRADITMDIIKSHCSHHLTKLRGA